MRLGIAEEIAAKAVVKDGLAGERAASGEVEIAVQQMSELKPVAGIDIVGPLPAELQATTLFTAAIFTASTRAGEAAAVIDKLTAPELDALFRSKGLEPAR